MDAEMQKEIDENILKFGIDLICESKRESYSQVDELD